MDIKELSEGYFNKTEDEKIEIIYLATRYYIEDMMLGDANLFLLKENLERLQVRSAENEHYEVTEVLGEIIGGINQLLKDSIQEEDNTNV
jgi:hypothetical protein